ncbi:MAG: flippase-like domain-containing protein [Planctomycetota bacterium]|jgi:hypothetical protein|nr:flippase-like domain-containing protein [Planctomycetota bacterium]
MTEAAVSAPRGNKLSRLEWLPLLALPALAAVHFLGAEGSTANRLAFWVALGLIPGIAWRLCGRPSWRAHRIFFALGLLAFMATDSRLRPGPEDFARIAANWHLVLPGMVFCLSQPLWGALRLRLLLHDSIGVASFGQCLRLCLAGNFFNIFLPGATGGDFYRVYAISGGRRRGFGKALAAVAIDRFLGFPPLILIILAALSLDADFFSERLSARLGAFIAAAAMIALILTAGLLFGGGSPAGESGAGDAPGPAWGRLKRIHRLLSKNIARKRTLPLAFLYGLASHVAVVVACVLFGDAAGVSGVPPLRQFLVVPLALAVNSIPGAPGGIGQGELAMATLLELAAPGLGNGQSGVLAMLLFRLGNIVAGMIGGAVFAAAGGGSPFGEARRLRRFEAET